MGTDPSSNQWFWGVLCIVGAFAVVCFNASARLVIMDETIDLRRYGRTVWSTHFMDVGELGWVAAATNGVLIAARFLFAGFALVWLDGQAKSGL